MQICGVLNNDDVLCVSDYLTRGENFKKTWFAFFNFFSILKGAEVCSAHVLLTSSI